MDSFNLPRELFRGYNSWEAIVLALFLSAVFLLTPLKLTEVLKSNRKLSAGKVFKLFVPFWTIFLSSCLWWYYEGAALSLQRQTAYMFMVAGLTFLNHYILLCYSTLFKLPFPMLGIHYMPLIVGALGATFWGNFHSLQGQYLVISNILLMLHLSFYCYHFVNSICGHLKVNLIRSNHKLAK